MSILSKLSAETRAAVASAAAQITQSAPMQDAGYNGRIVGAASHTPTVTQQSYQPSQERSLGKSQAMSR